MPAASLPSSYADPQRLIEDGLNPFYAWRCHRGLAPEFVAQRLGILPQFYDLFEDGHYLGLSPERILAFCSLTFITPDKLVTPNEPMSSSLVYTLIDQALRGRSKQASDAALKALEAHCVEAETELMHHEHEVSHYAHGDLLSTYLKQLAAGAVRGELGLETPGETLYTLLREKEAEAAHLKRLGEHPKPDPEMRDFNEAVLRIYGPDMTSRIWDPIRDARAAMKYRRNHKTPVPISWESFRDTIRRDPELLAPVVWHDEDRGEFINGKFLRLEGALDLMMNALDARITRWEKGQPFRTKAEAMEKQVACLRDWSVTPQAKRLMAMWEARQEIRDVLGNGQPRGAGFATVYLPPPSV